MRSRRPQVHPPVTSVGKGMLACMRRIVPLLIAVVLTACATSTGVPTTYDPNRCDRSGDESQRRSC
jgi:hypothetical protein